MNTILMSIKPKYVDKIFSLDKKYEYRKVLPNKKIDKIIVYSSSPVKKIVGELLIDEILYDDKNIIWNITNKDGFISKNEYDNYFKNKDKAIAYKIKKVIKYNNQLDLSYYNIKKAPQSYIYID